MRLRTDAIQTQVTLRASRITTTSLARVRLFRWVVSRYRPIHVRVQIHLRIRSGPQASNRKRSGHLTAPNHEVAQSKTEIADMQRCLWMLFAAMVFAILPREGTSAQGDNERAIMLRNLAAHLITNNLYSTRYDALLAKYNSLRGSGLCINKTVGSGDNCKTIIVVRHTEVSNPTGPYATLLAQSLYVFHSN